MLILHWDILPKIMYLGWRKWNICRTFTPINLDRVFYILYTTFNM